MPLNIGLWVKCSRLIRNRGRWIHFQWQICNQKWNQCAYCTHADIMVTKVAEYGVMHRIFIEKQLRRIQTWRQILNWK